MDGSYRDAAAQAPAPPRELPADVLQRCGYRGRLLRLFGIIWLSIGGGAALVTAIVALATGITQVLIGTAVGSGIAMVALGLWLGGRSRKRSGMRVFRDGLETSGEVVDVRQDLAVRVNGRHPWRVDYTFWASKSGATRGTETCWGDKPAVKVGDNVVVLYDPERPAQCALWTFPDEPAS